MYLWILVPKAVALNIERIASCLGSTVEKFVLPLDASKCVEMAMWAAIEIASVMIAFYSTAVHTAPCFSGMFR